VNHQLVLPPFETILPLAAEWAAEQERRILREGVPLSESEIADAKTVGVQEPQRVRLLRVGAIPYATNPILKAAAEAIGFLTGAPRGLTLRYGIFIRLDCWRDRWLLAHEFMHTAQYEKLGGVLPFLRKYLFECATVGYPESPLEQEANIVADGVCRSTFRAQVG
jgi:hypothetical protein